MSHPELRRTGRNKLCETVKGLKRECRAKPTAGAMCDTPAEHTLGASAFGGFARRCAQTLDPFGVTQTSRFWGALYGRPVSSKFDRPAQSSSPDPDPEDAACESTGSENDRALSTIAAPPRT